ncbi:MAG: sugar nucleotide-binding protein [Rhizomicrobium sp.]
MKDLLVVGENSVIGSALLDAASARCLSVEGTSRRNGGLDLADAASVARFHLQATRTAVICAAVASLSACERAPERALAVNVTGTLALAQRLRNFGIHPIALSTNLVFGGDKACCGTSDVVSPKTSYGRQKAEMERGILALGGTVLRLTKVLSQTSVMFRQWRDNLALGQPINAFCDMYMAPIPLPRVTAALLALIRAPRPGLVQLSADRDISYAQAASFICCGVGADLALVRPVSAPTEIALEARPQHTTLDTTEATVWLGWRAIAPEDTLAEVFLV